MRASVFSREDILKVSGKILNNGFLLLALVMLWSCADPVDLFSEYRGKNLISSYQFGEGDSSGWQPDHTGSNVYMTYEELSGVDLSDARNAPGLPDNTANVYRLEVKNQFINGDFEATPATIGSNADIGGPDGTSIWTSTQTITDNNLWVDNVNGNRYLEFIGSTEILYADLSNALTSYPDAVWYNYHIEFTVSGPGVDFTGLNPNIQFKFDDNSPSGGGERSLPLTSSGSRFFPGDYPTGTGNFWTKGSNNRLYFGKSTGALFGATIDNIRFIRADNTYAIRLTLPFSEANRLDLALGGIYTFSVYVKEDPTVSPTNNRFATDTIALEIRDLYTADGTLSVVRNLTSSNTSRWQKLEISAVGLIIDSPADRSSNMIELAITTSALNTAAGGNANTVYKLDAGSILIALPEFFYSPQR